ncbi:Senescence-associated protein AAF, chlorolplastic [Sesamum angolense]|uniref:Senescence-associated protein AAF, chlorolplastic n=1 Tax=Sesamum angolense TaxID=2727404 RepID=A0AAE1W0J3_9LAMI|nr:Senescence-associated protein AAF, chlorolplastic [Sesamum angolense]
MLKGAGNSRLSLGNSIFHANAGISPSGDEHPTETGKNTSSSQGLAEACRFVSNDAKFVNERARSDIILLSRWMLVRQDVAFLGSEFLKLDARAREDTEKIDNDVKRRAERLHHVATLLKNKAQSKLKRAADKHWSDGALEADLKRADSAAKQRAMEDSLMALEFVKNIHDMMEAYWNIASALSEADGIDYTDPEELELLVAALIDLDAMDGKSSVSLLAECSNSPDVSTRRALANALSAAPSMWTLGNAGMGALQRLAEDSNPAIAAAAAKTIYELKKQWEIEEGDSWRFMMNQSFEEDEEEDNTGQTRRLSLLCRYSFITKLINWISNIVDACFDSDFCVIIYNIRKKMVVWVSLERERFV